MTTDRMVVVRGQAGELADRSVQLFEEALGDLEPLLTADDVPTARQRLEQLRTSGDAVDLTVIGPRVANPLSAARELHRANEPVGVAFVTGRSTAESLDVRLALVPELRGSVVVVADGSAHEVARALREAAAARARRNDFETTIAAMNRQLLRRASEESGGTHRHSVSESYLAALVRHVPQAILSVDRERRIVAVNEAAIQLLGLEPHELTGATLTVAVGRYTQENLDVLVAEALAGRTIIGEELEFVRGDAGRMLIAATAAPVRDDAGGIVGAVLVARDITEKRRSEERLRELQKAQSLATLAGGVAHDFNNLLVTIKSWSQIAAEDLTDTATLEEALGRIQRSAERAADLARAMLVYAGRGRFEMEAVNVTRLVREMVELLRGSISRKIEIVLELDDDLPKVDADATQLRQVIMNLLTNAAEAIGVGSGRITLSTRAGEGAEELPDDDVPLPDRYVLIAVADDGPGITAPTRERLFEPFFTTKFEGRGLGLAASHGIVRAHGGALLVDSEPGRGATFRVLLPIRDQASTS